MSAATYTAVVPNVSTETFDVGSGIADPKVIRERRELMEDLRVAVGILKRSKLEVGQLLVKLRDGTPWGMWEPVLAAICKDVKISRATAHRYMELAARDDEVPTARVPSTDSDTIIEDAWKLVSRLSDERLMDVMPALVERLRNRPLRNAEEIKTVAAIFNATEDAIDRLRTFREQLKPFVIIQRVA